MSKVAKEIYSNLNFNKLTLALFLDLRKAFGGYKFDFLKSYLTEREQYVRIGDTVSTALTVKSGVPHGIVLDTLLFFNTCESSNRGHKEL